MAMLTTTTTLAAAADPVPLAGGDFFNALRHTDTCPDCVRVAGALDALQTRAIAWLATRHPVAAAFVQEALPRAGGPVTAGAIDVRFSLVRDDPASVRPTAIEATVGHRLHCPQCLGALRCAAQRTTTAPVSADAAVVVQCLATLSPGLAGGRLLVAKHRADLRMTTATGTPAPHLTMHACYCACLAIVMADTP